VRLSLRFIIPLGVALAAVAYGVIPLVDQLTLKWFVRDLDIRATLIANTMQESLGALLPGSSRIKVQRYLNRTTQDERLLAVGYCDARRVLTYKMPALPAEIKCAPVRGASRGILIASAAMSLSLVSIFGNALRIRSARR